MHQVLLFPDASNDEAAEELLEWFRKEGCGAVDADSSSSRHV